MFLYFFAPTLLPARTIPPGNGRMTPAHRAHRLDRRFRRRECGALMLGHDQQVAAADRLLDPERLLDEELAFHHRNPPVALAVQHLARLELVAEVTQLSADDDPLGRVGQAVEAGGRRTGEHGLADSIDQLSLKSVGIEAEEQHAHAGPQIGRDVRSQLRLDARLDLAADDGGREAGQRLGRGPRPGR